MKQISDNYEDIIHLPHHVSTTHAQMPIEDRAVQFAPFAALTGYEDAVRESARFTVNKRELDENEKLLLNEQLQLALMKIDEHPTWKITYFQKDEKKSGGTYKTVIGSIKKFDVMRKRLLLEDGTIIVIEDVSEMDLVVDK